LGSTQRASPSKTAKSRDRERVGEVGSRTALGVTGNFEKTRQRIGQRWGRVAGLGGSDEQLLEQLGALPGAGEIDEEQLVEAVSAAPGRWQPFGSCRRRQHEHADGLGDESAGELVGELGSRVVLVEPDRHWSGTLERGESRADQIGSAVSGRTEAQKRKAEHAGR